MFYSHQILARKGPLATVWMAAHLQHRLKKPHYNSVDINSTVDRIIFPEAPIALRMSGHLLLGVVRIYSKKVDYLYHDCNEAMVKVSKAFTPVEVHLTEVAATAPPEEVTLPERFELDAMNMEDYAFAERGFDSYTRSPEDITLPDPTPINMDHYVAITFEDLDMTPLGSDAQERGTPQPGAADGTDSSGGAPSGGLHGVSSSGVQPIAKDIHHFVPVDISQLFAESAVARAFSGPGPSTRPEETAERTQEHETPQSIEVMRHAVPDAPLFDFPLHQEPGDEQPKAQMSDQHREFVFPMEEVLLESAEQPPIFQPQTEHMETAAYEESPNLISFGQASVELALRSTPHEAQMHVPPVEVGPRRRKRKLYDEKSIVLSNKALKDALNDTSKIVRKKRRLPDNVLGTWRLEMVMRKEHIFAEPLLTGMCEDLHDIYTDHSEKPHLASTEEPMQEERDQHTTGIATQQIQGEPGGDPNIQAEVEGDALRSAEIRTTPARETEPEQSPRNISGSGSGQGGNGEESPVSPTEYPDIERLRRHEGDVGPSAIPEFTPLTEVIRSPIRRDDVPAVSAGTYKSGREGGSSFGPELLPTPDLASSSETLRPEAVATFDQEQMQQPIFDDFPELMKSPGNEELHFLEGDSTLSGSQGTRDVNSLSVRTRAVAQYLKGLSPGNGTPTSIDESAVISLNDILKNKSRKLCARMFYETLVLKSFDLIDVEQNGSYGDINLKLTSALKAQF